MPLCAEAFRDYRLGAVTLSSRMLEVVRAMLDGQEPTAEAAGLSKREWRELMAVLGRA